MRIQKYVIARYFCGDVSDTIIAKLESKGHRASGVRRFAEMNVTQLSLKYIKLNTFNNSVYSLFELQIFQTAVGC
jgi:hypothetical protein